MLWARSCGLFLILLLGVSAAFPQSTFQKVLPGAVTTWGTCAKRSSEGNLTFCTWSSDQFSTSDRDIILISLDAQGDTLWTRSFGGPYDDQSFSLITTSDGGYLIAGTTNTTEASNGPFRACLIRTNAQGDSIWTKSFSGLAYALALTECDDGGFIVLGWQGAFGLSMLRFDDQGELMWSRYYDRHFPPDFDRQIASFCITRSSDNNYFVGGSTEGGAMFLSKMDPSGAVTWARVTSLDGEVKQVEATPNGGVILFGYLLAEVAPGWDGVLAEMDSLGNTLWSKRYDSSEIDGFNSGIRLSDSGFSMIGSTQGVDPYWDAHILKTDSTGEVVLSRTFDGGAGEVGRNIVEASDGGCFILSNSSSFGSISSMWVIKTDSTGFGDCFQDSVTTVVTDVDLGWADFQLESFSSTYMEYSTGFGVHRGTTISPLCPVGVNEQESEEPTVRLSPNPAHHQFTVAIGSTDNQKSEVETFNALGVRVMSSKVTASQIAIDGSSLPRGIYLVKVTTATKTVIQRVVLE